MATTMTLPEAVLLISHDVVGPCMAGPGISYWELAKVLAQHFAVVLAAPAPVSMDASPVELWPYDLAAWETLAPAVKRAGVVILPGDVLDRYPQVLSTDIPLVVDGYDPHTLETLALFAGTPNQDSLHRRREQILRLQCRAGDMFLCASERQRDWWLGLLEANGRINAHTYTEDPSLRQLVDVVPYGVPSSPIRHTRRVLKGVWPGIGPRDRVVLWGGGLWQWLDPLTAIRAMAEIQAHEPQARLVFPGTRHPNRDAVPEMPAHRAALRLAEQLGLLNRVVFFGQWVPYADWPNYLIESDLGISLHLDTVEARLAFRSRVLDYVWAGLPMVLTRGDATSEWVAHYGLAELAEHQDAQMVAGALCKLLHLPPGALTTAFQTARESLTWERAAGPLVRFCRNPQRAADKLALDAHVPGLGQPPGVPDDLAVPSTHQPNPTGTSPRNSGTHLTQRLAHLLRRR